MYLDRRGAGPGVHALVIGVGRYPHLTGGSLAYDGHGDLTSAPVSALEFAAFVADESLARWVVPVASVDLLLSPAGPVTTGAGHEVLVRDATRPNVQRAYDDWLTRCNAHEDNVAVLYFCGHGIQGRGQILLTSDFGESANQPFTGAFDFDLTRRALRRHGPATQCVFVDACRMPLTEAVTTENNGALPLDNRDLHGTDRCRYDLTIRAPMNETVTARPREVSSFTRAVTLALNGQAAEDEDDYGTWVVTNANVSRKLTEIRQQVIGPGETARSLDALVSNSTVLRRLHAVPETMFSIACDPPAGDGRFVCAPDGAAAGTPFERDAAEGEPWEFAAPAGHYRVSANAAGRYRAGPLPVYAWPPRRNVTLRSAR
jgi:hypothetical protein